jgi:AraC family transcriptional regulator, regulatory protein of adaptative response / DNA-3-methyladenine glycosylase II
VIEDFERCYRAVHSRDARFDGWFFTAVRTTGIYCRPSCPATTPKPENVEFHPSAASAQLGGFRACKRCRPDATPGSPEWDGRADVVARAMRLIADGVVDRDGVGGLSGRLGYSGRHLHRQLVAEVGAGPLALARAQRAQTARILIETTDLPFAHVAFASGFASIRQFNDTVRDIFASTPTDLRRHHRSGVSVGAGVVPLRLAYRPPFHGGHLLEFLAVRAVAGVEETGGRIYRRTLRLPHGPGVVDLDLEPADHVGCRIRVDDLRDLGVAVQRCRRLLDLDADPVAVDAQLGADPLLGPLVLAAPGLRVPRAVDGDELALRAVLGQQVSVAGARKTAARLVERFGKPLTAPDGTLSCLFPEAASLADADPADLGVPLARGRALVGLARALADGALVLDPGADRVESARVLATLPGIGPWTAAYVAMRALGDPDTFLPTDLGVRHALLGLGVPAASADEMSRRWRPWRAYAVIHLWASLSTNRRGAP